MPSAPPTLLQIGGGQLQLAALRWARAQGLRVVLADADEAAPGRALVERFERLSGTDVPGLVALALELHRQGGFVGAYHNSDHGLAAVAAIGAATGTPHNPPEAVQRALDKRVAKACWQALGLPTPAWVDVASAEATRAAVGAFEGRAIVKPIDSSGSRGVTSVASEAEAEGAWAEARAHGERVIVERLAHGRHLDVNGLYMNGIFHPAGILDRHFTPAPRCVPTHGTQPATLAGSEETAVYRLLEDATRALGIHVGPVKADVILEAGGPTLLEVAPRFHGEVSTAHVTPLCFGMSPLEAWFRYLAGGGTATAFEGTRAERAAGWLAILPEQAGRFVGLTGEAAAREVPGITDLLVTRRAGTELPEARDNRSVCGFLWATGKSPSEVETTLRLARSRLGVIVD